MWPCTANERTNSMPFLLMVDVGEVFFSSSSQYRVCSLTFRFIEQGAVASGHLLKLKHAKWKEGNQTINQPNETVFDAKFSFYCTCCRLIFSLLQNHSILEEKLSSESQASVELKCPLLLLLWRSFKIQTSNLSCGGHLKYHSIYHHTNSQFNPMNSFQV